jgi:transposase
MSKATVFETINESAAGIDIGAAKIFVSPDGIEVKSFGTFTADYYECIEYLQEKGIKKVAMEATGVYWMALYAMLESCDFKVCLINPKETKQVKGRKTDAKDCRWIQKLFSAGILRSSFIPEGRYMELRHLVRERLDIIDMGSTYVNKMQKCLELMNIKLTEVISQIHGVSGIRMIKAIIDGNRDKDYLLSLCDQRIRKNKSELILKALEGNYNDTYLFILEMNMKAWEDHQNMMQVIDVQIEALLNELCQGKEDVVVTSTPKPIRHHAPKVTGLHQMMVKLHGVNMSSISGLNDYTLLRLIGETGVDMSRFPNVKHFTSWCGLTPKNHQTGKVKKRVKGTSCNNAGQIFKECAQGLLNSKYIAIGSFMRKLKGRKDAAIAIKAGARKLAEAFYNAITKGIDYVEQGIRKYEQQLKLKEMSILNKLAKKHKMQLVELHPLE